jgi:hypothetical protein
LAAVYLIFVDKLPFMILLDISMEYTAATLLFFLLILLAWLLYEFKGMKDEVRKSIDAKKESLKLRLQAYERLTVFADRASIKNLVARTTYLGLNVVEVQLSLLENIRTEYEYNVSQQIYVSSDMWRAIGNLKDQNVYIINQIASTLPSQAPGIELSKILLEYSSQKNADLSSVVLDALQFEAKKIL